MYEYQATLSRIVDGDTYDLEIDLGLRVQTKTRVRLRGVDTPETYGVPQGSEEWQRGQAAKQFATNWLHEHGPKLRVRTFQEFLTLDLGTLSSALGRPVLAMIWLDHGQDIYGGFSVPGD